MSTVNRHHGFPNCSTIAVRKGFSVPDKHDDADLLKASMQKGFPDRHRLVVTTDFVDRRKACSKPSMKPAWWWIAPFPKGKPGRTAWPGMP
jgi:hypothetical protein